MRKLALAATAALALALTLTACTPPDAGSGAGSPTSKSSSSSQSPQKPDDEATGATAERTGTFAGLNDKSVAGTVTVSADEIALAGFSSDEGPDLHVYLTNGTDEAAVSAGKLVDAVSFDTAAQSFTLKDVDVSMYSHVVIHCDKAKAVFGAADLT
jgi:ABC-type oligopeptide transport system substrate-binding subunit